MGSEQPISISPSCCFNNIVGLPQKDGREYPLFNYEKILYDSLLGIDENFKYSYLRIKKTTGLGITEFFLRLMGWLRTGGCEAHTMEKSDVHSHRSQY